MSKKILIFVILLTIILGGFYFYLRTNGNLKEAQMIISPVANQVSEKINAVTTPKPTSRFSKVINILLVGLDTSAERRKTTSGYRTDVMILLSINTEKNIALLTSVPRDLWVNNDKINAIYMTQGEASLIDAFQKISGQKVDGMISIDFDMLRWLVDSFGGIPVTVERTFTDTTFPNNSDTGVITATFVAGSEILTPERALTFARSRHGDNGEGSDLMRAKRQHIILKGMIQAVSQPKSKFWPMDVKKFYEAAINQKIYTSLTLDDAYAIWDLYKDRDKYSIESFVVSSPYIYHPGMYPDSPYRAWVFVASDGNFASLHKDIQAKIDGTFELTKTETTTPASN